MIKKSVSSPSPEKCASVVEPRPTNEKRHGSVPSQGMCQGWGPGPFLSPSLPFL